MSEKRIHSLQLAEHERVRSLFTAWARVHLNITAVLEGHCPGEVYVDDVTHPRTACLISGDGYYLAGDTGNRAFNLALNTALPRDRYFVLFCNPVQWEEALGIVLQGTYAIRAARCYYTLEQIRIADWQDRIPAGFSVERVSAELLDQAMTNSSAVEDAILDTWRSLDAFVEHGFGFCLVHGDDIVSWSLADHVSDDRCEIGVYADWNYRRRGFGTFAAAANAAHAIGRGFAIIGWHCWENNVGSSGVAEKVGFQRSVEYDVYINHWAAENVTDMTRDEFRAFAESYEREFKVHPPASGFPHIVAAKARALSQDRQGCFHHLHQAVDLGWLRGVDHLREIWPEFFWEPDLDEMPEWRALVERLERQLDDLRWKAKCQ